VIRCAAGDSERRELSEDRLLITCARGWFIEFSLKWFMALETPANYFELFGLTEDFAVPLDALTKRYRELQQTTHPDRFVNASDRDRRLSMQQATQINEAYQALKDPLARARYLLQLRGIQWDDEQETVMDPAFLMEQMEWREALGEARTKKDPLGEVGGILNEVLQSIRSLTEELGQHFGKSDDESLQQAKSAVRKLQFLYKLRDEAEALEADLEDEI
jgi:molecular chaperone HscB